MHSVKWQFMNALHELLTPDKVWAVWKKKKNSLLTQGLEMTQVSIFQM